MLTRLEVNGFKNLLGVTVDFGPFTCIAGPNGSGKSNLFDVIHFLSLLADHEIMQAAQLLRNADGRSRDPRELFWTDGVYHADKLTFAAEMLVPQITQDDFGREAKATTTFLRYELEFGYEAASGLGNLGRLVLLREHLNYIRRGEAGVHLPWPHRKREFRDHVVLGERRGTAFISTEVEDGTTTIKIHQDGGSRGQPRPAPAESAPRTIVCTTTTASDPTILAARREMQRWRILALEPSAMRSPDAFAVYSTNPFVGANGSHLAATLYRQAHRATGKGKVGAASPERTYSRVTAKLARLVPATGIRVDRDDRRDLLTLELQLGHKGPYFAARALSDGTLRFLALCILDNDPEVQGLLCMEEPENGIHPERMQAMVEIVRGLAVDPTSPPAPDNPFRQVIVNTHSPAFVRLQQPADLLFAKPVTVRGPNGGLAQTLRLLPIDKTWRATPGTISVQRGEILAYLTTPPGAQLGIDLD